MSKEPKTLKPSELHKWTSDINPANKAQNLKMDAPVMLDEDGKEIGILDRDRAAEISVGPQPVPYVWGGVRWTLYCDPNLIDAGVMEKMEAVQMEYFAHQELMAAAMAAESKAGQSDEAAAVAAFANTTAESRKTMMELARRIDDIKAEAVVESVVAVNHPDPSHVPTKESVKAPFGLGRVQREALLNWANFI